MKFSEFKNNSEMLAYFGLEVRKELFINFETITPIPIPQHLEEDLLFVVANRGNTDWSSMPVNF